MPFEILFLMLNGGIVFSFVRDSMFAWKWKKRKVFWWLYSAAAIRGTGYWIVSEMSSPLFYQVLLVHSFPYTLPYPYILLAYPVLLQCDSSSTFQPCLSVLCHSLLLLLVLPSGFPPCSSSVGFVSLPLRQCFPYVVSTFFCKRKVEKQKY